MKLFWHGKDGGPESNVDGYFLIEWKDLFSIALLKFSDGSRDAYHDHAFDAVSWILKGVLFEFILGNEYGRGYRRSFRPIITRRSTFHKVVSVGTTWILTFRGPWSKTWHEHDPRTNRDTTLTHGRREVP
jgi:hypothetical protein